MDHSLYTFDSIAVIGLGYVGLPLAVAFGKKYKVIGFDIDASRIKALKNGTDRTLQTTAEEIQAAHQLSFSDHLNEIKNCRIYIINVPTPVDALKQHDLKPLLKASEMIGGILKKGELATLLAAAGGVEE